AACVRGDNPLWTAPYLGHDWPDRTNGAALRARCRWGAASGRRASQGYVVGAIAPPGRGPVVVREAGAVADGQLAVLQDAIEVVAIGGVEHGPHSVGEGLLSGVRHVHALSGDLHEGCDETVRVVPQDVVEVVRCIVGNVVWVHHQVGRQEGCATRALEPLVRRKWADGTIEGGVVGGVCSLANHPKTLQHLQAGPL